MMSKSNAAKMERDGLPLWRRIASLFGWTRHSTILFSAFLLTVGLIVYVWWPLAEEVLSYIDWTGPWWHYMDWLLLGIFFFMSLTIMARADLRIDAQIIFVATLGGLVIESWGTQTNLWHYYTAERPPLWIIPAWPIATLTIDRMTRLLVFLTTRAQGIQRFSKRRVVLNFKTAYWVLFVGFYALMLSFVAPTMDKSYTLAALLLCALFILTPTDHRLAFLTFVAGAGLGYFLELWGTTRECWTYYTHETPPFFAVLAHGMAAVAFWRAGSLLQVVWGKLKSAFVPSRRVLRAD